MRVNSELWVNLLKNINVDPNNINMSDLGLIYNSYYGKPELLNHDKYKVDIIILIGSYLTDFYGFKILVEDINKYYPDMPLDDSLSWMLLSHNGKNTDYHQIGSMEYYYDSIGGVTFYGNDAYSLPIILFDDYRKRTTNRVILVIEKDKRYNTKCCNYSSIVDQELYVYSPKTKFVVDYFTTNIQGSLQYGIFSIDKDTERSDTYFIGKLGIFIIHDNNLDYIVLRIEYKNKLSGVLNECHLDELSNNLVLPKVQTVIKDKNLYYPCPYGLGYSKIKYDKDILEVSVDCTVNSHFVMNVNDKSFLIVSNNTDGRTITIFRESEPFIKKYNIHKHYFNLT